MIEWDLTISNILNLVFIAVILWEVILLRKNSRANVWQDSINKLLELDKMVIQNQNLQEIFEEDFFEREAELSPAQRRFILSYISCFEQLFVNKDSIQGGLSGLFNDKKLWTPWKNYMEHVMSLPAFQSAWRDMRKKQEFVEDFQDQLDRFVLKEN